MGCSVPKAIFLLVLVVILSIFNITDIQAARGSRISPRGKNIPAQRRAAEQRLIACSASLLSTRHLKNMIFKLEYIEDIGKRYLFLGDYETDKSLKYLDNNEGFMELCSRDFLEDERVFNLKFEFSSLFRGYSEICRNPNSTQYERAKKFLAEIAHAKGVFEDMTQAMIAVHGDSGTEE